MRIPTGLTVLLMAALASPVIAKSTSPVQTPNVKTKNSRRAKRPTKRHLASPKDVAPAPRH